MLDLGVLLAGVPPQDGAGCAVIPSPRHLPKLESKLLDADTCVIFVSNSCTALANPDYVKQPTT